jgi:hypothetical protein
LVLTFIFVATPIGAFFGSTYFLYVKYALQGFGDTAAYMFYLAGLAIIAGPTVAGPSRRCRAAFAGALLLALATFVRPVIAPAVAVLLGGAGIAALSQRQWGRLGGLCIGFLPILVMPLHNCYFGGVLVLFSANIVNTNLLHVTLTDYVASLSELLHFNFLGPHLHAVYRQLHDLPIGFLAQPQFGGKIGYAVSVPVHLAAIAIVVYVACFGRRFDPWLRLTAGATVAQLCVALFYGGAARYFFLTWFLTMLVVAVWFEREGIGRIRRLAPNASTRVSNSRLKAKLSAALSYAEIGFRLRST